MRLGTWFYLCHHNGIRLSDGQKTDIRRTAYKRLLARHGARLVLGHARQIARALDTLQWAP